MAKKLRVNSAVVSEFQTNDDKTKPNIRLVKAMSGRPQYAKKELKLDFPVARLDSKEHSMTANWLPYVFGALMAFGFAYLQSGQMVKPIAKADAPVATVAATEEVNSPSVFSSPLLETVRALEKKAQR